MGAENEHRDHSTTPDYPTVQTPENGGLQVPDSVVDAVAFAIEIIENPRVEGAERGWAKLTARATIDALRALPADERLPLVGMKRVVYSNDFIGGEWRTSYCWIEETEQPHGL